MPYSEGVNYADLASKLRPSRAHFPNATTLAEYRPNSLTLHFHYITRESYADISHKTSLGADRSSIEVVAHELTHWSDHLSSAWGQNHIVNLFETFDATLANNEAKFHKTISFFDEERRIILPKYYHVVEGGASRHSVDRRWSIDFTAGQEFNASGFIDHDRPIFFVVLGDNETRARIARQPITVGALLETTATWAEIRAALGAFASMEQDEKKVEQILWSKERSASLYNEQLTIYTAPVHMFANFNGIGDVIQAYERGALLAQVALNMTGDVFDKMRHPASFEAFGERLSAFVRARNRGYAFAALARHSSSVRLDQKIKPWIDEVLNVSGMPSYDEVMHKTYQELETLGRGLVVRSKIDAVRDYLLEVGRARFLSKIQKTFAGGSFDPFGTDCGPTPPMFDANANLFSIGTETLDSRKFDPESMYDAEWRLRDFTENFLQGCRGFERSS